MKKTLCYLFAILLFYSFEGIAQENEKKDLYLPKINGTIRTKFEYATEYGEGRFQVRNARFALTGKVHPIIGYKAEIDLSDEGRIVMKDAFTQITPTAKSRFKIGQFRLPFTIDAHRSPHIRYFANRSFLAKQVGNVMDVGASASYLLSAPFKVNLETGLFNGKGLKQQRVWLNSICYTFKATMFPVEHFNLTLSFQHFKPSAFSMKSYDVGTFYEDENWHFEVEYLLKNYEKNSFKNVHTFNSFILYKHPIKKGKEFLQYSIRYDMMTDHSNGIENENNQLIVNDHGRKRITAGICYSFNLPFTAHIKLNFEKYFGESSENNPTDRDKILIEFLTRF